MCVPNLHCEYQELKPKVETNTSFLVRHPFSGVDTVKTVRSHLKHCRNVLFATIDEPTRITPSSTFIDLIFTSRQDFNSRSFKRNQLNQLQVI